MSKRPSLHDLTEELLCRAHGGHVVRLSDPATASERLQLLAARWKRTPIIIMPKKCETLGEWLERYGKQSVG